MAKVKGLYRRGNIWWLRYAGPDGKVRYESSRTSSNRHIGTLKHMSTKAVEWEMVEEEVLKKVRRVKLPDIEKALSLTRARIGQLIRPLVDAGLVVREGQTRATTYRLP